MIQKYIITGAEVGADPNFKQLNSYRNYAERNNAEILIIPLKGQYPDEPLAKVFDNYNVVGNKSLSSKLEIKDFGVKAQNINPLTGLKRFGAVDKSLIISSTKQHLEHVANSATNKPKALICTGVCTLPNYKNDFRIGKIAQEDHVQGAVIIEVDTETDKFFFRQVQNLTNGSFIDQTTKYEPNGKIETTFADTMVLGDLHVAQIDRYNWEATLEMINFYKPKYLVLHDCFDGYSITHHDIGRHLLRASKSNMGQLSLKNELYVLGKHLNELSQVGKKSMEIIIVKSNHDETLDKYLDACRFIGDSENLTLSVQLANYLINGEDPLQKGIEMVYGQLSSRIKFLSRDDEFKRYGYHLSSHGDKGMNGGRGSMKSFETSLGKAIVGHSHSSKIRKNVLQVGTLERTDVEYVKGSAGAWTATNAVIYPNGKTQLQNIINGEWRYK